MQELYLLRHGLAVEHGTPEYEDDDRPLTPDGERRIRQIGRGLKKLKLDLDRIATSPLPRASKTAEIVADCLGVSDRIDVVEELRAGRDASSIRDWLASRKAPRLMIVGHNPAFSDLIGLLVTGSQDRPICELRKGGIAALRGEPGGRYLIDWIARPKVFHTR
jgi:phosphohistidine phosphatase